MTSDSKETVVCRHCKVSVRAGFLQDHLDSVCRELFVKCVLGCGLMLKRKNVALHLGRCKNFTVSNQDVQVVNFPFRSSSRYEEEIRRAYEEKVARVVKRDLPSVEMLYPSILAAMAIRNDEDAEARAINHLDYTLPCPFCPAHVKRGDFEDHHAAICPMIEVPCFLGCGEWLPRADVWIHLKRCRNYEISSHQLGSSQICSTDDKGSLPAPLSRGLNVMHLHLSSFGQILISTDHESKTSCLNNEMDCGRK
mmetsp:Transcript_16240/g.22687  ORF Transcript_16240/g.22687 Transcript_16240/m.22687 type:complete len:252 (-) Transcript_16240:131-886(-)